MINIVKIYSYISNLAKEKILSLQYKNLNKAFCIASHLSISERVQLYLLSQGKKNILEIGSYIGASACCFGVAVQEMNSGKIFCVDTWNNDSMSEGNRDTFTEFIVNTKEFRDYIVPVRGFSTDVVDKIAQQLSHVDLLFIDGDHSYEGVKADWDAYKSFLVPGSVIVFHDSGWAEGVKQVIEEDAKPMVTSFNNLPNMWWGIIKG